MSNHRAPSPEPQGRGNAPAPEPVSPRLELLGRFNVELDPPLEIGSGPLGRRRVIGIVGGHFRGPRLSGDVLPGGADWQLVYGDGTAAIDTRYTLRTGDGALVSIATQGLRHGPTDVLERLNRGEPVDPIEYYFRVFVRFETGDDRYDWLNRVLAVASAVRTANAVRYDAYELR